MLRDEDIICSITKNDIFGTFCLELRLIQALVLHFLSNSIYFNVHTWKPSSNGKQQNTC